MKSRGPPSEGTEPPVAKCEPESLAKVEPLMEEVCQRKNLEEALKRVMANKGVRAWTG